MDAPPSGRVAVKVVGIGSGGHARVLADALVLMGASIVGFTDIDPRRHGQNIDGLPVLGDDTILSSLLAHGVRHAFLGVGGVADNRPRAQLYERVRGLGFEFPCIIHPAATLAHSVRLGEGAVVLARAVLNPGVNLGENAIVNTGGIVDHDCVIGAHAHIAPGAVLSGGVVVSDFAHIGTGAVVKQGVRIGAYSVIGAGAVVIEDVPENVVAKGIPARVHTKIETHG